MAQETVERGLPQLQVKDLQYAVFVDADLVELSARDVVEFESFLLRWLPAVGLPFLEPIYGHIEWFAGRDVWPWAQWDDAVVAYHWFALPKLFSPSATPGYDRAGWAARWRHRVWALMFFPGRVLLTTAVRLHLKPGGLVEAPEAEVLINTYTELVEWAEKSLAKRFQDRGDLWKVVMLSIPHPMQQYCPVITNGLRDGVPIGCHKCQIRSALPGAPSEYANARPVWDEVITGDVIRLHGLAQNRLHWVFLESEYLGGFAGVAADLAARALLPVEAARRYDVASARADFAACMAPGGVEDELRDGDLPPLAMRIRQLPVRDRTFLYALLLPGPTLQGTCWPALLDRQDTWLLVVTWKEPLEDLSLLQHERLTTAYFPKSNIQEAKLSKHWIALEIMAAQGWRFEYVVRADADACLRWGTMLPEGRADELEAKHGSPTGAFHDLLSEEQPPVAVVHNVVDASAFSGPFNRSTGPWDLDRPCVLAWDHRFHAVSAEALPLYAFDLAFQPLNWNTADVSVLYRLGAAFAGRTVSYSVVELDVRTLSSSQDSYLKVLGDDSVLPTVAMSWERTWLPLAHRVALGLPRHLRRRALYSFWMEWEAGDGASDCLAPVPRREHERLWASAPAPGPPPSAASSPVAGPAVASAVSPPSAPVVVASPPPPSGAEALRPGSAGSAADVCAAQRRPHVRWPVRSGVLVLLQLLERLITDFLGRVRRLLHQGPEAPWAIAGVLYEKHNVLGAFVREIALHLRVYELVGQDAFSAGFRLNYTQPFSAEVRAQLRDVWRAPLDLYGHIASLEDAARAFRADGGGGASPAAGRAPLLMHLQLRPSLAALPAEKMAHHDPRGTLPRPSIGQIHFAKRRPVGAGPDDACDRAAALPDGDAAAGVLCVGSARAGPPPALLRNATPRSAELPDLIDGGRAVGRCTDWLGVWAGAPSAARAAACFRELVQGFRYKEVLFLFDAVAER